MKRSIGFAVFVTMLSGMSLLASPAKAGGPAIFFYETDRSGSSITVGITAEVYRTRQYRLQFAKGCTQVAPGKYEKVLSVMDDGDELANSVRSTTSNPGTCLMNNLVQGDNMVQIRVEYSGAPRLPEDRSEQEARELFSGEFHVAYPFREEFPIAELGLSGSVEMREVRRGENSITVEHSATVIAQKKYELQFAPECRKESEGQYTRALRVQRIWSSAHPIQARTDWKPCVLENPAAGVNTIGIVIQHDGTLNDLNDLVQTLGKKFTVQFAKPSFERIAKSEVTVLEHTPSAVVAEVKASVYDTKTYSFTFDTCIEKAPARYVLGVTVTQGAEGAQPQHSWRRSGACRITNPANGTYMIEVETKFAGTWNVEEKMFVQKGLNMSYPIIVNYAVSQPPQPDEVVENDVSEDSVDLTVKVTNIRYVNVRSRRTGQVYKRYLAEVAVTNQGDIKMQSASRLSYKRDGDANASYLTIAGGLAPNETRTLQVFFTKESRGMNVLFAVDPKNTVEESNEQNNTTSAVIQKWYR